MYYSVCGRKDKPINIFLHGWGQSGESFKDVVSSLNTYQNVIVDLPPFGKSQGGENNSIFSYANMVISLCEHLNIKKANFFGHSFGGRIAILVAALRKDLVQKLVLIDSAGMKPRRGIKYYFKVLWYKIQKKCGKKPKNAGSSDYQKLSEGMKATFVSVVNTHLEQYCKLIEAKTFIVFGRDDRQTPIYMAKRLNKLIKGSKLSILEKAGHFCFQDRNIQFCKLVKDFLLEEET